MRRGLSSLSLLCALATCAPGVTAPDERVIAARKANAGARIHPGTPRTATPKESYTQKLLADPPLIGEKIQEEAEEVARAAREESDERVAEEAADLLYHLTVLLASRELTLEDAYEVLNARRR